MLILDQLKQTHTISVAGQEVTFTVRPSLLPDLDLAYVSSREDDPLLAGAEATAKEYVTNLRAGRTILFQRITGWEGVYLSETEPAPCTQEYLSAFFGKYPRAFMDLADLVHQADEGAEKN